MTIKMQGDSHKRYRIITNK